MVVNSRLLWALSVPFETLVRATWNLEQRGAGLSPTPTQLPLFLPVTTWRSPPSDICEGVWGIKTKWHTNDERFCSNVDAEVRNHLQMLAFHCLEWLSLRTWMFFYSRSQSYWTHTINEAGKQCFLSLEVSAERSQHALAWLSATLASLCLGLSWKRAGRWQKDTFTTHTWAKTRIRSAFLKNVWDISVWMCISEI